VNNFSATLGIHRSIQQLISREAIAKQDIPDPFLWLDAIQTGIAIARTGQSFFAFLNPTLRSSALLPFLEEGLSFSRNKPLNCQTDPAFPSIHLHDILLSQPSEKRGGDAGIAPIPLPSPCHARNHPIPNSTRRRTMRGDFGERRPHAE
jgi:hypothetical protein